jgi:hypothetical protein
MATYKEIAGWVKEAYGFSAKTCWIAHVKSDYQLTTRQTPNRRSPGKREQSCPAGEKRLAIENALCHFKMI